MSNLVSSDLDRIRKVYEIPDDFTLRLPDYVDNVCSVNKGDIVLYEADFKAGLRLPFHPIIGELLHRLGLGPGQLTPNAWRIVVSCLKLWPRCSEGSAKLSVKEFLYCYKLVAVPNSSSHWYFVARDKNTKLVTKLPSSNGSWKSNYFLVHGEALLEGVNWSLGDPNKSALDRPHLDDLHLDRVKMAVEFSRRDHNSLVTPQNLVPLSGDAEKSNQKRMNTNIQSQKKAKLPILGKRKASSELASQESSAHGITAPVIGPTTSSEEAILPLTFVDGPPRPSKEKELHLEAAERAEG
ncbi:hypothetical protein RGQ29_020484 [Quercus rubra]|nr:hypothetical protein RGQ29_020484 [Quercus rubra]